MNLRKLFLSGSWIAVLLLAPFGVAEESDDERGYFGFRYVYEEQDDGTGGFRVDAILPGSPAAKSGLERGDLIVRVNGQSYRTEEWDPETLDPFAWVRPGDTLEIELLRGEERRESIAVITAERLEGIGPLQRKRGNASRLDRAEALLQRLASEEAVLRLVGGEKSAERIDATLGTVERELLEYFLFEASPLGRGLVQGLEPGASKRVRMSVDPESGRTRFDTLGSPAEAD